MKYNNIIQVLTREIEQSLEQVNIKDLKHRIQSTAEDKNVESQLRTEFISKLNEEKKKLTA